MVGKPKKEVKVDVASLSVQESMQQLEFDIDDLEVSMN